MPKGGTRNRLKKIDVIGLAGVLIALIFGWWGIRLTYRSINTSVDINHFNTLLYKTDISLRKQSELLTLSQNQIDSLVSINKTLSKQFNIISKQYALSIKEHKRIDSNSVNLKLTNEERFYIATQNLHSLIWQPYKYPLVLAEWKFPLRLDFLNQATSLLNGQLDNPFLLVNKNMLQDWINVRDSVFWCIQDINFLPNRPIDTIGFSGKTYKEVQSTLTREWRNSFIDVSFLEQTTSSFMAYYRFRADKIKRFPYMQIKVYKKLEHVH